MNWKEAGSAHLETRIGRFEKNGYRVNADCRRVQRPRLLVEDGAVLVPPKLCRELAGG